MKQKWWGHVARIEYVTCLGGGGDTVNNSSNSGSSFGEEIYASALI